MSIKSTRRKGNNDEDFIQMDVFRWWKVNHVGLGVEWEFALYHVPNGGARDKRAASIFKMKGIRAGIPDLILDVPRGKYHGARFELKADRTRAIQKSQKEAIKELTKLGYYAKIVCGYKETIDEITMYLLQ